MTEYSKEEELDFMSHPDKWPHMVRLPLKRRDEKNREIAYGYLFQPSMRTPCPPPKPIVYIGNMFHAPLSNRTKEYESLEAIVNDGWMVD